jgi:hypothetical protein
VLFDPAVHEASIDAVWDPEHVREAIRTIVDDAENAFDDGWPTHPTDSEGPEDDARRFRTVYLGGAGVVQALDALRRRDLAELRRDYVPSAGNGYAFLALFARTGDELWLDRARAFAMHAVARVDRARAELGRGRYTLWSGDPGTALYLADCLDGRGDLPLP